MALQGTVTAFLLNVRNAPSLSGKAFTQIKKGTVVDILEQASIDWVKIQLADGRTGYVAIAYLSVKETAPDDTPPDTPDIEEVLFTVKITSPSLNVRAGASTTYAVLGGVKRGDTFEVYEVIGDWYRIIYNDKTAYIHGGYTEKIEPVDPEPEPTPSTFHVKITAKSLNVRAGTSTNYAVLGGLQENDVVEVFEVLGDWYRINFNGKTGYIHSDYAVQIEIEPERDYLIDQIELLNTELEPDTLIPRDDLEADEAPDIVARTWNDYGGLLERLATHLSVPVSTMVGVLAAESGGRPYGDDGRLKIRFEVHIFYEYWGKEHQRKFDKYFQFDDWKEHKFRNSVDKAFKYFHDSQKREHKVLEFAKDLDNDAALMSISMGAPQIMGFNYAMLGYETVQEMYDAFLGSVHAQILGMFDYIISSGSEAIIALQNDDYLTFATYYNGAGNAETYANLIADYVAIYNDLIQQPTNPPPIDVIDPPELELMAVPNVYLNFRNAPNGNTILSVLTKDLPVKILESKEVALPKFGQYGQWLHLENSEGQQGYAAAWLMSPMHLLTQENVNNYIDQIPDYTLPDGYHALWANQEKLGLPNPFDVLPFQFTSQTELVNLQVNGFGPNTFALWYWENWYKNTAGMHNGTDYIIKTGTPLLAVSDGVIIKNWIFLADSREVSTVLWCFLPEQYRDSQGRRMMSNVLVAYGHLTDNSQREHREVVQAGDIIGIGGEPVGSVDNDHLHLEVHLLQGDPNLPYSRDRGLLSLYKGSQKLDNMTPHNPLLFFSPRIINYHLRQGAAVGFRHQYPDYPTLEMMKDEAVYHLPQLNQLSLAYYQYGVPSVWKQPATGTWPEGVVTTDLLEERIQAMEAFEPYEASFLD